MRYKVIKPEKLLSHGFELQETYDGDEDIESLMGYVYEVYNLGFEKWWIEVPRDDYDDKGNLIKATPYLYCLKSSGYAMEEDDIAYFLPKLVEIFNAGLLEVENE